MLNIIKGVDNTQLVFYNHILEGVIEVRICDSSILYLIATKSGLVLGETSSYGLALKILLGSRFERSRIKYGQNQPMSAQ